MAAAAVRDAAKSKFFISESLSSQSDPSMDLTDAWGASAGGRGGGETGDAYHATTRTTTTSSTGVAAAGTATEEEQDALTTTGTGGAGTRHRRSTSGAMSGRPPLATSGFSTTSTASSAGSLSEQTTEDEIVPTLAGATQPVPIKQSADGLFCKVQITPVVSPPSSLLSEQFKRSPTQDSRVPLLGGGGNSSNLTAAVAAGGGTLPPRRISAPAPYSGRRAMDVPRRADERSGPPVLLEGTESLRRQLMHERAPVMTAPRVSPHANGDVVDTSPAVFSFRSKVTGW